MPLLSIVALGLVFYAPLLIMWKARASSQSPLNNIPGPQATSWLKGASVPREPDSPTDDGIHRAYGPALPPGRLSVQKGYQ